MQLHRIELRIEHKEILRKQPAVSNETAALAGDARVAVQEIRKGADIAVGNERSSGRVRTQRRRSGSSPARAPAEAPGCSFEYTAPRDWGRPRPRRQPVAHPAAPAGAAQTAGGSAA